MRGPICILFGGPIHEIEVGKKTFRFEDHSYAGPTVVLKNDNIATNQPGERSPFWKAINAWIDGGKRLNGNKCVYELPKKATDEYVLFHGMKWAVFPPDTKETMLAYLEEKAARLKRR